MQEKIATELEFIYRRRSVRKFLDTPVSDEVIEQLIDAAVHAPSGKNLQTWHFVVVRNNTMIQDMVKAVEKKHEELLSAFRCRGEKEGLPGSSRLSYDFQKCAGSCVGVRGTLSYGCR